MAAVRDAVASSFKMETVAPPLPWSTSVVYAVKAYLLYGLNSFTYYIRARFEDHVPYTEHPPSFTKTYDTGAKLPIRLVVSVLWHESVPYLDSLSPDSWTYEE